MADMMELSKVDMETEEAYVLSIPERPEGSPSQLAFGYKVVYQPMEEQIRAALQRDEEVAVTTTMGSGESARPSVIQWVPKPPVATASTSAQAREELEKAISSPIQMNQHMSRQGSRGKRKGIPMKRSRKDNGIRPESEEDGSILRWALLHGSDQSTATTSMGHTQNTHLVTGTGQVPLPPQQPPSENILLASVPEPIISLPIYPFNFFCWGCHLIWKSKDLITLQERMQHLMRLHGERLWLQQRRMCVKCASMMGQYIRENYHPAVRRCFGNSAFANRYKNPVQSIPLDLSTKSSPSHSKQNI